MKTLFDRLDYIDTDLENSYIKKPSCFTDKDNYNSQEDYDNIIDLQTYYIREMKNNSDHKYINKEQAMINYYFLCFFNQLFRNFYYMILKKYNPYPINMKKDEDINSEIDKYLNIIDIDLNNNNKINFNNINNNNILELLNNRQYNYRQIEKNGVNQNYFESLLLPIIGFNNNKKYTIDITMIKYFNFLYTNNDINNDIYNNIDNNIYNNIYNNINNNINNYINNIQENNITYLDFRGFIPYLVEVINKYQDKNKDDYINSLDNDILLYTLMIIKILYHKNTNNNFVLENINISDLFIKLCNYFILNNTCTHNIAAQ